MLENRDADSAHVEMRETRWVTWEMELEGKKTD